MPTGNFYAAMQSINVPWGNEATANYFGTTATMRGTDQIVAINQAVGTPPETATESNWGKVWSNSQKKWVYPWELSGDDVIGAVPGGVSIPSLDAGKVDTIIDQSTKRLALYFLAVVLIVLGIWTVVK